MEGGGPERAAVCVRQVEEGGCKPTCKRRMRDRVSSSMISDTCPMRDTIGDRTAWWEGKSQTVWHGGRESVRNEGGDVEHACTRVSDTKSQMIPSARQHQ